MFRLMIFIWSTNKLTSAKIRNSRVNLHPICTPVLKMGYAINQVNSIVLYEIFHIPWRQVKSINLYSIDSSILRTVIPFLNGSASSFSNPTIILSPDQLRYARSNYVYYYKIRKGGAFLFAILHTPRWITSYRKWKCFHTDCEQERSQSKFP